MAQGEPLTRAVFALIFVVFAISVGEHVETFERVHGARRIAARVSR